MAGAKAIVGRLRYPILAGVRYMDYRLLFLFRTNFIHESQLVYPGECMRYMVIALASLVITAMGITSLFAEENQEGATVAVLPFEVSQTGQYAYLNRSIRQMLISRLVHQGDIKITDLQLSAGERDTFMELVRSGSYGDDVALVEADWVVDGSMYSLKDGLQVNLTFYSMSGDIKPVSFTLRAENPDDIMPAITELVAEVHTAIFSADDKREQADSPKSGDDGLSGFQTAHPERAYKKGLYGGATLFGGDKDDRFQSKGIRKSSSIPLNVESVTLGDLDGDGINELVASSRSKIRLFRLEESRFRLIAEYDFSPRIKIHVLNIADPGNTGIMKLFVSANEGKHPASAVLTWDGSKELQLMRQNIRWYIRPVWWPGKEMILAGQKDSPNISDYFLAPGVFELVLSGDNKEFGRGEKLLLPKGTNLFDFIVTDINGDNEVETMVIDEREKLLVYDSVLNLIWVSSANYGGSKTFFGPAISEDDQHDPTAYRESENSLRRLVYIPGRMVVKDVTGDGLPEVVVSTNDVGVSKYLENIRSYDGGSVACLAWRGGGLMELWRTNRIDGYVADYAFDNDGEAMEGKENVVMNRLYVAQIPDSSIWKMIIPGSDNSRILAYEMTIRKELVTTRKSQ